MGGGDGLSFLVFPFTMEDHTTVAITDIDLTTTIRVGIAGNKEEGFGVR